MNTNADDQPVQDNSAESEQPESTESTSSEEASDATDSAAPETASPAESAPAESSTDTTSDQLPDWELTPELVEEEAIRGDFMLRWAVVLLGVLYGFGQINDTQTLVHIKSGEYQLENGILPPGTDVFSYTAADRDWVQLSWLFDLLMGGIYGAGGFVGVAVAKALIAGVLLYIVVHVSRSNVPTWWTSICGAGLLVGVSTQLTARPELMTMLGVAILFWMLNRWQQTETAKLPWQIPVLFLVWANVDPRMYVGLVALLLYGVGDYIGKITNTGRQSDEHRKQFWIAVGASFVAALLNPFGWQSLLAIQSQLSDYAAFQEHLPKRHPHMWALPLTESGFWEWRTMDVHTIVALSVVGVAVSTMILNAKRLDAGHVMAMLGLAGLATLGSHELAAAAVAGAIFAGLNGQDIYLDNCRQTYSLAKGELIFSRAGRAFTVLGFVALAYLFISGNLSYTTPRLGIGASATLQTAIDATVSDMDKVSGERPFNFNLAHGDILLWAGQKPFIDTRIGVYSRGETDIAAAHRETRKLLRSFKAEDIAKWKETRDKFQFTSLVPRCFEIDRSPPDYVTARTLLGMPTEWRLEHVGSGTMVFVPTATVDVEKPEAGFAELVDETFDSEDDGGLHVRAAWARPRTTYEKYLTANSEPITPELLRSRHLSFISATLGAVRPNLDVRHQLALPYLAIQNANQTLAKEPQSVTAYMILGQAYRSLAQIEGFIAQQTGSYYSGQFRIEQSIAAYYQAAKIQGDWWRPWWELYVSYSTMIGKTDLALDALNKFRDALGNSPSPDDVTIPAERRQELRTQMEGIIKEVTERTNEALEAEGADSMAIATSVWQQLNCTRIALDLLENDTQLIQQNNPQVDLLRATLYINMGDMESADLLLERLESGAKKEGIAPWFDGYSTTRLAYADYPRAIELFQLQLQSVQDSSLQPLTTRSIASLPFRSSMVSSDIPLGWPIGQLAAARDHLLMLPNELAELRFRIAVARLESGDSEGAAEILATAIKDAPQSPKFGLMMTYVLAITGEPVDTGGTANWIDIDKDGHPVEKSDDADETEKKDEATEKDAED